MRLNTVLTHLTRRRDGRVTAHVKLVGFTPVRLQEMADMLVNLPAAHTTQALYFASPTTIRLARKVGHQLDQSLRGSALPVPDSQPAG